MIVVCEVMEVSGDEVIVVLVVVRGVVVVVFFVEGLLGVVLFGVVGMVCLVGISVSVMLVRIMRLVSSCVGESVILS